MFGSATNLGFPRKVVACYLLFSLAILCWLAVGVLLICHKVINTQTAEACLSSLGKTASRLEISYLQHGDDQLQAVLLGAGVQGAINYAEVISTDGTILAHTDPELVGTTEVPHRGSLLQSGDVQGVRFYNDQGLAVQEYQVPLAVRSKQFGKLKIAFQESSLLSLLSRVDRYAPLAILLPLALVLLGGRVLWQMTGGLSEIDKQLRKIAQQPSHTDVSANKLKLNGAAALGWNRLLDALQAAQQGESAPGLDQQLKKVAAVRNENEMAEVLQNLSDGIVVTDLEGKITFANKAIEVLLGRDSAENPLQGNSMGEALLSEMPQLSTCQLFEPQNTHRQVVSEAQRQLGNTERILRVSRQPMVSESADGLVWSVRDVTQQKLADKMRDQFIDTATHELRTPLSNIKAYAEMLATSDRIEVERQKEFCNIINSEVTRLARFVDDLLSLSSMEVGSLSADRQQTDTARLFEEVLTKVQPLMDQKNIQFEVRLPEKMRDLMLDKEKMVAVLVNLLGNAAKYTPEGGHVSLRVKLDENLLEVAVEDTGVGIAEDELSHVFDKFFRSSDERIREEIGTGLGLSLAREVVLMHGGDITVDSTLDKGSTFQVTIPLE